VLPDQWPDSRPWLRGTAWYVYWPIYDVTTWLLLGGFAVFFYADRRAARKTEARLREAELEHLRKSKIALESRLQAMQARVEPQFLFNTLSQVEHLYELDRSIGQRMLDDLIVYLRAAMPLMRSTSSTVAQELELARAYLNIVRVRLGNRLTFEIDVPEGIGDACLPPMMLLPLIDHAIVVGLEKTHAEGRIRIGVEPSGKNLRLVVVDSGAGFIPEAVGDGIGAIRDRLEAPAGVPTSSCGGEPKGRRKRSCTFLSRIREQAQTDGLPDDSRSSRSPGKSTSRTTPASLTSTSVSRSRSRSITARAPLSPPSAARAA
jgi:hypothetical protein